jgi:beta-phosphoglucomutase-like phosphatase (HAD superfamily)
MHKGVRIEGDPFEDAVAFLNKMETDLKRYKKEGSFGSGVVPGADAVVEQAFQRILRMVTATSNTQSRRKQLAEKCQQLKSLFPDAAAQIDRLFRKEAEMLDEP